MDYRCHYHERYAPGRRGREPGDDVAIRGETIAAVGPGLAAARASGTRDHRCDRALCHSRRRRRARSSRAAVLRHGLERRLEHRHPRGGARRRDDRDRLRHPLRQGDARSTPTTTGWPRAKPKACVDYCFHIAITNWDRHGPEMEKMVENGLPDLQGIHDLRVRGLAGRRPGDLQHARAVPRARGDAAGARRIEPRARRADRPPSHARARCSQYGATAARDDPAQLHRGRGDPAGDHLGRGDRRPALHRPHVDRARGPTIVKAARARGVDVYAETCAQYLVLDDSVFDAARRPSLRLLPAGQEEERPGAALERACTTARSRSISTDTCTFTRAQKARWEGDWTKIPMGLPGLETLLPIVYTHGVLGRPDDAVGVRRQVLHQPGQADGPLSRRRASIARGQRRRHRDHRPRRSGSRSIARRWRRTPTGARTRAGRWRVSPRRRSAAAGRSSTDYKFVGESGWGRWLPRERAGSLEAEPQARRRCACAASQPHRRLTGVADVPGR